MIVAVVAACAMLCVSCGPKEGVIAKDYKIDLIMAQDSHYVNDAPYFSTGDYVEQDWNWDGDEMYRIDYHGGEHPYQESFFHEGNRIVRTTVPAYNIRVEYFYGTRQLEHIEVYASDELYSYMAFVHDGQTLTDIVCHYFEVSDTNNAVLDRMSNPLRVLVGDEVAGCLEQNVAVGAKGAKDGTKSVRYKLSWNGDNPTRITCTDAEGEKVIYLTYEETDNPFYQLYGFRGLTDPIFGFGMLSRNNIRTIRMPYNRNKNQLFTYSYEYDGDAVAKRTLTYSYPSIEALTLDSVMYKVVRTERFSYIKE